MSHMGGGSLLTGVTIALAASALRPPLIALGPLAPRMMSDLGISHAAIGLLGTASIILVGITSLVGPRLTSRVGLRAAMAIVLGGLTVAGLLRASAPTYELILLATLAIGALIGPGQTQPPVLARARAISPQLGSLSMTLGLVGSAVATAYLAVPLAEALGGWRPALAILALPAALSLIVWIATVGRPSDRCGTTATASVPWRDREAWWLAVGFGLQAALYTSLTTWLTEMLVEDGSAEGPAAGMVGALNVLALVANVALLVVGTRLRRTSLAVVLVALGTVVAAVGLAVGLPPILTVALMGLSLGAILPLFVTLALQRGQSAVGAGALTALMFAVGYVMAGLGPLVLGAVRDASGDFGLPLWLLALDAAALTAVAVRIHRAPLAAPATPATAPTAV